MSKNILVLGRHEDRDGVDKVEDYAQHLSDASKTNSTYVYEYFEDLILEIIDGQPVILTSSGKDIASYDLVFMMGWFKRFREEALCCALYLEAKKVPYFNKEALNQRSISKITQYIKLALNELPIPDTIYARHTEQLDAKHIVEKVGLPLIMKKRGGSRGDDNYMINTMDELEDAIKTKGKRFVFQRYTHNDGDLRVLVMNGEVTRVIKRHRVEGSHLSNTSQGAQAEMLDLESIDDYIKEISIKASYVCDREITGVDVMLDLDTNEAIILEVNNMPQLVSGVFVREKVDSLSEVLERAAK